MKIIHISDLHVSSPNYQPEWGKKVVNFVNSQNPDLLVITGDLINEGHIHEYEMWEEYFAQFNVDNHIIVPGNHDARNDGWKIFEEKIGPRHPVWENESVVIQGIDSSEPDLDDGNVGRHNYSKIRETMSVKGKVKILMMHHHLIPIPGTGRERQIPADAGDVLEIIRQCGIHMVISGHKHKNWIWNLEGTYFISCGTSTSRRLKGNGYPSLMIYDIENGKLLATNMNLRDNVLTKKLNVTLNLD
ncbi:MAG: metallophosphoesterase [Candidatus Thermoplasmatota archaeon]|nr:metallophosphoesterase [Candidatus Thermoplasmatota archaeon]MBU4072404.1 metallophosphoesterase [Candidatus Thermoplasmatota archaeon]MBU4144939.1 metallophosphoesterase [Candidatus Thermoplasmatota archaeon]MBU4591694.1 metallophosphoesterase [Candidatus Thermoplasmatota archaeon]